MNKHFYMAVMSSIILGLYIPKDMQFAVTIMIMSSIVTYIGINYKEFFKGDDEDGRTDSDIQK